MSVVCLSAVRNGSRNLPRSVARQLPYRSEGPRVSSGFYDRYAALTKRQPTLTADTSSPRGTLTLFLDNVNEIFEIIHSAKYINRNDPKYLPLVTQVYRCLDLSEVPEYSRDYVAGEAAVCLKEVLDPSLARTQAGSRERTAEWHPCSSIPV